ncbi:hypothetical protein HMPREF9336_00098 [Segniliparus rugosus ATCC BAA-974]|uniref:SnoaL-like domain-containing protein n=2 Tax=Segniliparus rugosus TaxID=286804 RepID=E5XKS9_SEGRC|nr:hypothetical protein HMPREF9336_00098 [Segniliparus rugosus ATCC BAA-974]
MMRSIASAFAIGVFSLFLDGGSPPSPTPARLAPKADAATCPVEFPEDSEPNPELLTPEIRDFVRDWFLALRNAEPLDEMLTFYSTDKPVISFFNPNDPSRHTACDRAGFQRLRDADVEHHINQSYDVVSLEVSGSAERPVVHVTIIWNADDAKTGEHYTYSDSQIWTLIPGGPHGFRIQSNIMTELHPV